MRGPALEMQYLHPHNNQRSRHDDDEFKSDNFPKVTQLERTRTRIQVHTPHLPKGAFLLRQARKGSEEGHPGSQSPPGLQAKQERLNQLIITQNNIRSSLNTGRLSVSAQGFHMKLQKCEKADEGRD